MKLEIESILGKIQNLQGGLLARHAPRGACEILRAMLLYRPAARRRRRSSARRQALFLRSDLSETSTLLSCNTAFTPPHLFILFFDLGRPYFCGCGRRICAPLKNDAFDINIGAWREKMLSLPKETALRVTVRFSHDSTPPNHLGAARCWRTQPGI